MAKRANNFEIRLLTSSKDIGLRRLRSYTAALGSGAQIFHSVQDLQTAIESHNEPRVRSIILHDGSIHLTTLEITTLAKKSRIFILDQPRVSNNVVLPAESSVFWKQEAYLRCSLQTFLESPVIRMSMAQLCQPGTPFSISNLLRWGATEHFWNAAENRSLSDTGLNFVRTLNLPGECRRITEMFTHFIHINLENLGITVDSVRFSSDGIMTALIAKCRLQQQVQISYLTSELRVHDFYAGVINKTGDDELEIGALFYQNPLQEDGQEKIVLTLDKDRTPLDTELDIDLEKAG